MVWTFRALLLAVLLCGCAERHAHGGASGQAGTAVSPKPPSADGAAGHAAANTTPAKPGARASVRLDSLDPEGSEGEYPPRGEASFRVSEAGVDMSMSIRSCKAARTYEVYILAGSDCSSETLAGEHWDSPRGEGFPRLNCGTSGFVRAVHARSSKDAKPWTIDGPAASNLIGHAMAVYDGDRATACGVIMRDESVVMPDDRAAVQSVPVELRAQIAGLCLARTFVRDNTHECPNAKEVDACARERCDIDPCVRTCSESGYIGCLQREQDACEAESFCEIDEKCAECRAQVSSCTLNFCLDKLACAAPVSPNGPCSQLLACCAMQGDMAATCYDVVAAIAKLSGDPSCYGVMHDWDFFSDLRVPCKFE